MSDQRRQKRGRPKGSGIDDWERLLAIAALMENDPKLLPTTAIKQLGFSDPSTIRRLRDKFRINRAALLRSSETNTDNIHAASSRAASVKRHKSYTDMCPPTPKRFPPQKTARDALKQRHLKRAQDALSEYAHLADCPSSFVNGFQAGIAHCLLQKTQDHGVGH